ncbi:hypothetical protein [Nocardia sp. NPDC050710]|uniref:hypothetical protein n=1 Tax=Nocardia sp. NPDC050710 TaxID=3157220 RepID=UPI0033E79668
MKMRIKILEDANPGERTRAQFGTKTWPVVWRGKSTVQASEDCDIELDIDGVESWLECSQEAEYPNQVSGSGTEAIICGSVSFVYDDDVFVLDIGIGSTLVESDSSAPSIGIGQFVCFIPTSVSVYPTMV